jgi:ATP-dependent protease ClpP protease subunit
MGLNKEGYIMKMLSKKSKQNQQKPMDYYFSQVLDENRYILLYDEINNESATEVNTKLLGMSMVKDKNKPIILEINSPGVLFRRDYQSSIGLKIYHLLLSPL